MTKQEITQIARLAQYRAAGADAGMIARALSGLIRAARTNKSRAAMLEYGQLFGVTTHRDFII